MPSGVKDIQLLELKDTISQLNKTISTQNELISSLQKMLEERNAKDSEKDLLIANLQSQLAYLKNKVFGSTSEIRHDQLDGQLNLFGTPVGDEKPAEVIEPEVISVKGYTKERKPKATYDDKYNSVRSICKHFFTDIVGLSIKFFCVSLRHMSISLWVQLFLSVFRPPGGPGPDQRVSPAAVYHAIAVPGFYFGVFASAASAGHGAGGRLPGWRPDFRAGLEPTAPVDAGSRDSCCAFVHRLGPSLRLLPQ